MIEEKIKKPKLDFIVIGFTKCGTTWLYNCLNEHPDICMARPKEGDFFINEDLQKNPGKIDKYNNFFSHCKEESVRGEVSPMYVYRENALYSILENYPNVKLIIMLRNPLEREISTLFYKKRFEKEKEFNLEGELRDKIKEPKFLYSKPLKKWIDKFTKESIFPIILEEVAKDSEQEIKRLYSFLNVDNNFIPNSLNKKSNKMHKLKFSAIQKKGRDIYRKIKRYPLLSKILFVDYFKKLVNKLNREPVEKPGVSEELKKDLKKYFSEDISALENLLGKDLSIWR